MLLNGWSKDKYDPKDYIHPTMGAAEIPRKVNLDYLLPTVRDQGPYNSCVGHGIGAALCGELKALGIYAEWTSPQMVWNGARFMEGTLNQNVGVQPGDGWDWTYKNGIVLEPDWPYNTISLDMTAPSSTRLALAIKYPDFTYLRCVDGAAGIMSALAAGHLVAVGGPWFTKWENPLAGLLADVTVDDPWMGHETVYYGYDQDEGWFNGLNSWGLNWANSGKYLLPFGAIDVWKQLGGYDAQFCSFSPQPAPNPAPPSVVPSTCPIGNGFVRAMNFGLKLTGHSGRLNYK